MYMKGENGRESLSSASIVRWRSVLTSCSKSLCLGSGPVCTKKPGIDYIPNEHTRTEDRPVE
jgi:hypothetical protein